MPPEGVTAKILDVTIGTSKLAIGIKGNPPFIDVRPAALPAPSASHQRRPPAARPPPPAELAVAGAAA